MKVTVDTNVLPIEDLRALLEPKGFEFLSVTVTDRELEHTSLQNSTQGLGHAPETAVWDESRWDEAVWDDGSGQDLLEKALDIVGDGSFPKRNLRAVLSKGQRHQLRDAIIAVTHLREGNDVLLTGDLKGFVNGGRRERFRDEMGIEVMTPDEFRVKFAR